MSPTNPNRLLVFGSLVGFVKVVEETAQGRCV